VTNNQSARPKPPTQTQVNEAVRVVLEDHVTLAEDLKRVQAMFKIEDAGWAEGGTGADGGMTREQIAKWSGQIREAVVGNPWIKTGIRLRNSYIFQDGGIRFTEVPDKTDGRSSKPNVQERIDNPINQKHFFSQSAHKEREEANYTDGNVYYLGDNTSFELEYIPFGQITAEYRNPDSTEQIWAYRREWVPGGQADKKVAWYFTDTYWAKGVDAKGARLTSITRDGEKESVDTNKTLFDGRVNTQLGWSFGVPDAISALIWARVYSEFMTNGKIMTDALAQFAFQAAIKTGKGQGAAALQLAQPKRPGSTVVTGGADQLVPLSSAGKGYDFSSGVAILAAVATSIGVSVIHLSADPGTAGGSYGSASTLDLPTLLATEDRRDWHIEFDLRVLRWMGAPDASASFRPLSDPTNILRMMQALLAGWNAGLYDGDDMRAQTDAVLGLEPGKAPDGIMLPNNSKFVNTVTNDGQDLPQDGSDDTKTKQPGTGKGQSTGAGNSPKSNDLRSDQIAQALESDEIRAMFVELLERVKRD